MAELAITKSSAKIDHEDYDRKLDGEWEYAEKVYLPPEIILEIMGYLDVGSVVVSSATCSGFYEASHDGKLWERFLRSDWRMLKESSSSNDDQNDNGNNASSRSYSPIDHQNHDEAASYELLSQNGEDHFEKYKDRYLQYKKWRNSIAFIYSEERNEYIKNVDQGTWKFFVYIKYFLSFPILFYRLLIFLFISQDEQPDFGLAHEIEYIQEKSLRAGGSLLLFITFLPLLMCTWMIGQYPESTFFAACHVIFKIAFTILCIGSNFYNRMDKNIESYREANIVSLLVMVQTILTLILMRYVDDFLICCLIAFNMSTALGLAISLKHMIKNTESVDSLFESSATPAHHYLSPFLEVFRNRPVGTNLILTNLIILVIMIGGFKTFILILIFIAIALVVGGGGGGGGGNSFDSSEIDRRTIIFFVVAGVCCATFALARTIIGGNYKNKSKAKNTTAIILLIVLTLSFVLLIYRVISIMNGNAERWPLSLFDIIEETKS